MNEWAIVVGGIAWMIWGGICYYKGYSEGIKKKDEDIEIMLNKAIKKSKED